MSAEPCPFHHVVDGCMNVARMLADAGLLNPAMDELQARLQRVEEHVGIAGHAHANPAALSQLDRAENVERVRIMLREWNGYDSTPEEEAEADARLNALVGRAQA